MDVLVGYLVFWALLGGGVGAAIGTSKGRGVAGFWLGALLGFIGWIIVAVMEPTPEVRAQRNAELANAIGGNETLTTKGTTRLCPWCAEDIKSQARICRFCNREVEPLEPETTAPDDDIDRVRAVYPKEFETARTYLDELPVRPDHPNAWLSELCKRISAGSPPHAAAARIPLDWFAPQLLPVSPDVLVRQPTLTLEQWSCSQCGAKNYGNVFACDMCSSTRPPDAST